MSGVRLALAATLELERRNGRYALCTMCIGVGQGIAMILSECELIDLRVPYNMTTTTKLDPIETASRDELVALQTERLKWTLKHAYENVPMYRRKFDAAGVHPTDFRELSDLSKFRAPPSRTCATTIRLIPSRYRWSR